MKYFVYKYQNYNQTFEGLKKIFFPKNIKSLIKLLKEMQIKNIQPLIVSGGCGYGDKSYLKKNVYIINLKNLNKIKKINRKKKIVLVEAGVKLKLLFSYLKKKNFFLYNLPGGSNVSVAGAISGNVHGRPQEKNFSTFGDNVVYIKVLNKDLKIQKFYNKNKEIYNFIGSFGFNGIILEAGLKINKLTVNNYKQISEKTTSIKEFKNFDNRIKSYYGFIDYFNNSHFAGVFTYFLPKTKNKIEKFRKKSFSFLYFLNLFRIDFFLSYFINNYTLKILYFIIFKVLIFNKKEKNVSFEESLYFANINNYLPFYFRGGMLEIQFSVSKRELFRVIGNIKSKQKKANTYPIFFIVKKMRASRNFYYNNFPKYNYCISLGYSKSLFYKNFQFFKEIYSILKLCNCDFYLTKDEIITNCLPIYKKKLKRKKQNIKNFISNEFYEKIFK